jgi:DNA-directed RNA polymerase subunit RPC12/RpoP
MMRIIKQGLSEIRYKCSRCGGVFDGDSCHLSAFLFYTAPMAMMFKACPNCGFRVVQDDSLNINSNPNMLWNALDKTLNVVI